MNQKEFDEVVEFIGASCNDRPSVGMVDDTLFLNWDDGPFHFEIEIPPDGPAEIFYKNRDSGFTWMYPKE